MYNKTSKLHGCAQSHPHRVKGTVFCAGEGVEKTARKVSHAYMQGLNWVLAYYVHGNTPVPVSSTHADAVAAAERQLQGKGRQSSAADSAEGLGASWDW